MSSSKWKVWQAFSTAVNKFNNNQPLELHDRGILCSFLQEASKYNMCLFTHTDLVRMHNCIHRNTRLSETDYHCLAVFFMSALEDSYERITEDCAA